MKVLCLADLHLRKMDFQVVASDIRRIARVEGCDCIAVAGDIFDIREFLDLDLRVVFDEVFSGVPGMDVVFCLGNHEFAHRRVKDVLSKFRELDGTRYHCLDVCGRFDFAGFRFVGNVLWYDGSLSTVEGQPDAIPDCWLDHYILDFDWKAENAKCVRQIDENLAGSPRNILLTHCVPHARLNTYMSSPGNVFNKFSGMADLISGRRLDYAICGHTHSKVICRIGGTMCVNVGNDYGRIRHFLLDTRSFQS